MGKGTIRWTNEKDGEKIQISCGKCLKGYKSGRIWASELFRHESGGMSKGIHRADTRQGERNMGSGREMIREN
jgi:hypothetical protein